MMSETNGTAPGGKVGSLPPVQVCEQMKRSLFRVESYFGVGAGFAVGPGPTLEGKPHIVVATAKHVVEEATKAKAEIRFVHEASQRRFLPNREQYQVATAASRDIAMFWIGGTGLDGVDCVRQAPAGMLLRPGARVFWMGYPGVVHELARIPVPCIFAGIVSAIIHLPSDPRNENAPMHGLYVLDGMILRGTSGGPVFEEEGRVVGVAVARYPERDAEAGFPRGEGITLAIPLEEAISAYFDAVDTLAAPARPSGTLGGSPS